MTIVGEEKLTWFQSSQNVRRGFCSTCGSSLFWDRSERDWIAVAMGAFDGPTESRANLHIYVAARGIITRSQTGCRNMTPFPRATDMARFEPTEPFGASGRTVQ